MRKTSVQSIELKDGSCILVEVEEGEVTVPHQSSIENGPAQRPGTVPTGTIDNVVDKINDVAELLRQNLSGMFETVAESMKKSQPDEWGVEVSIGFKGTTNFIPVILSGEANAAIKVHAKWMKNKEAAQQNG